VGTRTQAVGAEKASSRQLGLLGEAPAAPAPSAQTVDDAYDPQRRRSSGRTDSAADRSTRANPSTRNTALPRLAVSPDEAAEMLGISRDYFDEHVIGELRIVRRGRRILVAVDELDRWLTRSATRAGTPSGHLRADDAAPRSWRLLRRDGGAERV